MQYNVSGNITHDGKVYTEGDVIELTEEQAAPLQEIGVLDGGKRTAASASVASQEPATETIVGGEPGSTGEPSIDAPGSDNASRGEAEDVTPKVSDSMKRDDLEAIALEEGISSEAIEAASTKASLVSLIEANRAPADAAPVDQVDPSVNL